MVIIIYNLIGTYFIKNENTFFGHFYPLICITESMF